MSVLVVSISHKTASLSQLAQVALPPSGVGKLVHGLLEHEHIDEALVLSTCNRTEVYAGVGRFHGGLEDICSALAVSSGLALEDLSGLCSVYYDEAAVAHLFRVAAGLDSMVAGENQILGQVRAALVQAQQAGGVGTTLNTLFQQGIRVGKRVQHETAVGAAGRSLMTAALERLDAAGVELSGRRALVLGAGSMASLAAHTVSGRGAEVTLVNRTFDKARRVAAAVGGAARPWDELAVALGEADLLITCTGARGLTIGPAELAGTDIAAVVDLALPVDVDPAVGAHRLLISLADLQDAAAEPEGLLAAQGLVAGEVADFLGARRAAQVAPTVVALRRMASEVVSAELARLDAKAPGMTETERAAVHQSVRRVVEKLLHQPTVRVQDFAAGEQTVDYAAALRELFALDPQRVQAVTRTPEARER